MQQKNRLREFSDFIKYNNTQCYKCPRRREKKRAENSFGEITVKLPKSGEGTIMQIQRHREPPTKSIPISSIPRYIVIKIPKVMIKQEF